ncbi:hypothetical protein HNR50_003187 [Spirochaeta isovalerica]|uniref:Uncharacterized protein n=1 Tax=Spirochaeta isovalerica TaxID=150 RepID=A0A841RE65_9SPIO|nr:hypothetical protein [Spirochaeta isovalerica]
MRYDFCFSSYHDDFRLSLKKNMPFTNIMIQSPGYITQGNEMRKLFLFSILLSMSFTSFAQKFSEPFDFYIYSFDEAGGLFNLFRYFDQMESGEVCLQPLFR